MDIIGPLILAFLFFAALALGLWMAGVYKR